MTIFILRQLIAIYYILHFVIILFSQLKFFSLFLGEKFNFHGISLIK